MKIKILCTLGPASMRPEIVKALATEFPERDRDIKNAFEELLSAHVRDVIVKDKNGFPKRYIKRLLRDAYRNSLAKVKDKTQLMRGATITKSISQVKRKSARVQTRKKR